MDSLIANQNFKCALTGDDLIIRQSGIYLHATEENLSLDRIDSTKGYIEGNVQWVTKIVNFMKRDYPQEDFIETCKKIVNYENTDKQ